MSGDQLFPDDTDKLDPLKVLAHMEDPTVSARWEGSLKEMVELAELELLKKLPEKPEAAPEIARAVVFSICSTMGGSVIYLPRGEALKRAMRDAEIYREWLDAGAQPHTLVRKYRLSSAIIYGIIKRQRSLHRQNGPDLFGFDQEAIH